MAGRGSAAASGCAKGGGCGALLHSVLWLSPTPPLSPRDPGGAGRAACQPRSGHSHMKGFTVLWMCLCCFRPEDVAKVFPQSGQACARAPTCWDRMCRCKLLGSVKTWGDKTRDGAIGAPAIGPPAPTRPTGRGSPISGCTWLLPTGLPPAWTTWSLPHFTRQLRTGR